MQVHVSPDFAKASSGKLVNRFVLHNSLERRRMFMRVGALVLVDDAADEALEYVQPIIFEYYLWLEGCGKEMQGRTHQK